MNIEELRSNYRSQILEIASKYKAGDVRIFGSFARGEKNPHDIDILVKFLPEASLLDEAGLERELNKLISDYKIDIIGDDNIRDEFKKFIFNDAVFL